MRVRCFTQDDAHIFMTPGPDHATRSRASTSSSTRSTTSSVSSITVELSTRPENSIGTDEMWDLATDGLQGALDELGVTYAVNEGDGAFYGPKIDFHLQRLPGPHLAVRHHPARHAACPSALT